MTTDDYRTTTPAQMNEYEEAPPQATEVGLALPVLATEADQCRSSRHKSWKTASTHKPSQEFAMLVNRRW